MGEKETSEIEIFFVPFFFLMVGDEIKASLRLNHTAVSMDVLA